MTGRSRLTLPSAVPANGADATDHSVPRDAYTR
jgi:hypothetical protein